MLLKYADIRNICHCKFLMVPCYCPLKLSNEHSYQMNWILTQTEVINITATTILDIKSADFHTQAELEEAFIYIIHKPIDFSFDKGPQWPILQRLRREFTYTKYRFFYRFYI